MLWVDEEGRGLQDDRLTSTEVHRSEKRKPPQEPEEKEAEVQCRGWDENSLECHTSQASWTGLGRIRGVPKEKG